MQGKSDAEKQKILRKRKKAAAKAAEEAGRDDGGDAKNKKGDGKKKAGHKEDEDPDGEMLAKVCVCARARECVVLPGWRPCGLWRGVVVGALGASGAGAGVLHARCVCWGACGG